MLLSYAWLQTYLPKLPPPAKLMETMLMHGLDVEGVVENAKSFNHVVVGEIVGIKPHPNADKLRLAEVVITPNGEPQEIVCGAPNIEVGQKVPVALVGAKLPNGLTIEPRAIRGITSNGMLCAKDELGLGVDHTGIYVLDSAWKVGTPFSEVIGDDDTIFDASTPANRADLMSMRGLAWEIGGMLGQKPKFPGVKLSEGKTWAKDSITLKNTDEKLCPLLTTRVIRGVKLVPTPDWMVDRLRAAGMRSVNIIADITNYIMLEYGQPLHAYDLTKVQGATLNVRLAKPEEHLITLDSKMRQLANDTLVIADGDRVIGIAGVMGGKETEVTETTTDIIIEAAIFNPVSIRKTSRRLGLISEASKRFEKGLWPALTVQASAAVATMIVELCGGTVETGLDSIGTSKHSPRTVTLNPDYITDRLGMKVTVAKSKAVLTKLGFKIQGTVKTWEVAIPEWRPDVAIPEDIVDEVGRMIGYEDLPKLAITTDKEVKEFPPTIRFKEEVKNMLVEMGFTEVISHAFYGEDNAKIVKGKHFEMENPLDATQHKLRKSLLPQIDDILKRQADAGRDAMIFEIGNVFDPEQPGLVDQQQSWKLALGFTHKGDELLKKTVETFRQKLVTTVQPESYIVVSELVRGRMIEFCEFDLKEVRLDSKVIFGAWDPDQHIAKNILNRELSKYPAITRDIAFWWSGEEATIHEAITGLNVSLLKEFSLKDKFVKDNKTSYTWSFLYQSPDRTLTKVEVDNVEQKIKDALGEAGAIIR